MSQSKTQRVPLIWQGKNPMGLEAQGSVETNDPDNQGYLEVAICCYRKNERSGEEELIADILVGLCEKGDIRVLVTTNSEGDGDHNIAIYPMRPTELAVEAF